jgi:hypothetical protein
LVPFTFTDAPTTGLPSLASVTTPETEICCAETKHTPKRSSTDRKIIFLFMELDLIYLLVIVIEIINFDGANIVADNLQ